MRKPVLFTIILFILAIIFLVLLAVSYQRVIVIDGIGGLPISNAYITLERSSGSTEEVGQTDDDGRLVFWTSPLPLPRIICAQFTFYPPACMKAISLSPHLIELAVPAGTP
jgi:hypothetical protein